VQQFFKNAAEVKGEQPFSSPAGDETPRAILQAFQGDSVPCNNYNKSPDLLKSGLFVLLY
jgi:hypothetical protein